MINKTDRGFEVQVIHKMAELLPALKEEMDTAKEQIPNDPENNGDFFVNSMRELTCRMENKESKPPFIWFIYNAETKTWIQQ